MKFSTARSTLTQVIWLLLSLFSWFILCVQAHAEIQQPEAPAWDPQLIRGQLDNGLRYVAYNSGKSSEPFNLRLIVRTGAIDETGPSGIAHGVEHMVFQTTQGHPETIHRYLQDIGWKTGLQINAVTQATETQYMIRTRPQDALDLPQAVALLTELALFAEFDEAHWQAERQVILEEMRQDGGVASRINQQKKAITRNGSRYADRTTIGRREELLATPVTALQEFYQRFYVPNNMTLVASGAIDEATLRQALESTFGRVPAGPKVERPYVQLPLHQDLVVSKIQDPQGSSSRVAFGMRVPQEPRTTLAGQQQALENYFLRRLLRDHIRQQVVPATVKSMVLSLDEPTPQRQTLAIAANTTDYAAGLTLILTELQRLRQHGLDQKAFAQVKAQALKTLENNQKAVLARDLAKWEDKITEALLQESVLEAYPIYAARTKRSIEQLQLAHLNQRLRQILAANDRFVYFQVPANIQTKTPDRDAIEAQIQQLQQQSLSAPVTRDARVHPDNNGRSGVSAVLAAKPTALRLPAVPASTGGDILLTKRYGEVPVTEWQLSNGDRLLWLNRPTPDGRVYIRALSQPGYMNQQYPAELSQIAVQLWQQSGFNFWSAEQQKQWQAAAVPHWTWQLQAGQLDVGAVARAGELEGLFREYWHSHHSGLIRKQALPDGQDALDQAQHPASESTRAFYQLRYGAAAPAVTRTLPARAQLEQIARQHLAAPTTFYLIGPLEERPLATLVQRYLASIPRHPLLTPQLTLQQPGQRHQQLAMYDSEKATVRVEGFTPMRWTPEQAFVVSALNPLVQSALRAELRLRRSGVYSVAFEMQLDPDSDRVVATLNFSCAPERAEELHQAALAVMSDLPAQLASLNFPRLQSDIRFAEQIRQTDANTQLRRLILSDRAYGDMRYLEHSPHLAQWITRQHLASATAAIFPLPNHVSLITLPRHDAK